jgi:hypothetical protein
MDTAANVVLFSRPTLTDSVVSFLASKKEKNYWCTISMYSDVIKQHHLRNIGLVPNKLVTCLYIRIQKNGFLSIVVNHNHVAEPHLLAVKQVKK